MRPRAVAGPEQPVDLEGLQGKTLLDGVRGVACRRLLRLRIDNLFMARGACWRFHAA
jgi:hypothetical protein